MKNTELSRAILKDRGAARARGGHPWIYGSDVAEASGEAGDVVSVFDRRGNFLGRAFYNPRSEITLRIAERGDAPIDERWLKGRLEKASAYRDSLEIDADGLPPAARRSRRHPRPRCRSLRGLSRPPGWLGRPGAPPRSDRKRSRRAARASRHPAPRRLHRPKEGRSRHHRTRPLGRGAKERRRQGR